MSLLRPTAVVAVAVATLVLAALVATATRRHPDEALAGSRSSVLALEVGAGAALAAAGIAIGWQRRAWRPGLLFAVALDLPGVAVDGARAPRPRLRSRGGPLDQLTPPEREVLALMAEGHSNRRTCEICFLSAKTGESHVRHIFTKLGLHASPESSRRVLAVLAYLRA